MAKKKKDAKKKSSMREKAKKRAERNLNRGGAMYLNVPEGTELFKPKKGTYQLDVIPYKVSVSNHPEAEKGELWYQRTIWVHFGVNNKSYLCPRTINKPCPICEQVKELYNSDDANDRKLAGDMKAKERELYNAIDLEDQDKGIQLFNISYHLFGKALDEEIKEGKDEFGGFAELEEGKTLSVRFSPKKIGSNEFVETSRIDFEDRDDYEEDVLDDVLDLDTLLVVESYDNLQKALYETEDEDEEEDEDESEEDESEEDEDEEEDKKKKHVKKSGKKSSKKSQNTTGKKKGKKSKGSSQDSDDTDEDEEEGKKSKKKKDKKKNKSPKCPHGGTFGEDFDTLEDCDECELWTECSETADDEDGDE